MPTQPETKTILLVEDEPLTAKTERMQLEKYGYVVRTVTTGEQAVEAVQAASDIDLILMDIDLGDGMDGTQAAELILREDDIPIVFLSSHTEPEIVEKTEKITSYGYVVKSSSATVLDASIKMAFKLFDAQSAHKQAEEALQESEKRLALATESADLGIWDWDIVSNDMTWNEQMFQLYGVSDIPEDYGVEIWVNGLHPEDREFAMEAVQAAVREEEEYDVEFRVMRADGSVRYVHGTGVVIHAEDGTPVRMTGINADITERTRFEQELTSQKQYLEKILETTSDGFWVVTPDRKISNANAAYSRMSGYSKDELTRMEINDLEAIENPQETAERVKRIMEDGSEIFETKHRRKDGSLLNIEVSAARLDWSDGMYLVTFCRDITERKQAEEEIRKQLTEKETLLREVHHRVKNNIAHIENLLSLQAGSTANAEVKAALQDAISRVESMRVLYDKLLLSEDLREISIKNYAEGLIDSIVVFLDPQHKITVHKQLVDFTITAENAVSVGIIITELVTNVFKYAFGGRDNGMVSISLDNDENRVTITIQDNGVGIDERAVENRSPGFGLTIVKMLVEQFDGTYSSVNDHGTKSVVQLKL